MPLLSRLLGRLSNRLRLGGMEVEVGGEPGDTRDQKT